MSALLLLVVFVPATMIGLRHEASAPESTSPAVALKERIVEPQRSIADEARPARGAGGRATEAKVQAPSSSPPAPGKLGEPRQVASQNAPAAETAQLEAPAASSPGRPAEVVAAAPPPAPPPPPPPPAPAVANAEKAQPIARDVVVTGALLRSQAQQAQGRAAAKASESATATPEAYRNLLIHLQAAVRAEDRPAIIALINFPLRVEGVGAPRMYTDERSVERDFEEIFTPRVMRAIVRQKADRLTVRNRRAVVGNGEVWLAETCQDVACSPPGPVRIEVVSP